MPYLKNFLEKILLFDGLAMHSKNQRANHLLDKIKMLQSSGFKKSMAYALDVLW